MRIRRVSFPEVVDLIHWIKKPQILSFSSQVNIIQLNQRTSDVKLPVSARTIRRELNDAGLFSHIQATEHNFTEFDIQRRLAFANEYLHRNEAWWSCVFFSNMATLYIHQHCRISSSTSNGGAIGANHADR